MKYRLLAVAVGTLFLGSGCMIKTGATWTKKRGEPSPAWRFGSGKAASTFLRAAFCEEQGPKNKVWVGLDLKLGGLPQWEDADPGLTRLSEAFREADSDGNGVLSEREASVFAKNRCGGNAGNR